MSFSGRVGEIRKTDRGPLYIQLQQILREAIKNQILAPDHAIPPERELAIEYGISRITVRKAIEGLVEEGLLSRRRGAGTFVAPRIEKSFSTLSSFSEDMASRGRVPSNRWLTRSTGTVTPLESLSLGLSPGSAVYRFARLRFADGVPLAVEYSTIAGYGLPSELVVENSLYDALDAHGARPVRALQRLRALAFQLEQTDLLGVPEHHAGLLIERNGFLRDGRTVEFTQSFYRGDIYDFVAELSAG